MPSINVKLVRGWAGTSTIHRDTLRGLGLRRISDESVLPDTPATLGMIQQLSHLVSYERVKADFKPTGRRHTQGKKSQTGKKKS